MDLNLFLQVMRRFKFLVIVGVLLAFSLALLSQAKVSSSGLTYRQPKLWASHEQLLVTQPGCPLCQATIPTGLQPPVNLTTNAVVYANIASSDLAARLARTFGDVPGVISATPVVTPESGTLPIVDISGTAASPAAAELTAERGVAALRKYILQQQEASQIPPSNRIILSALGPPGTPSLVRSPSITRPIFIFLAVMIAFLGLAFVLENLRPRIRVQPATRDGLIDAPRPAGQPTASRQSNRLTG